MALLPLSFRASLTIELSHASIFLLAICQTKVLNYCTKSSLLNIVAPSLFSIYGVFSVYLSLIHPHTNTSHKTPANEFTSVGASYLSQLLLVNTRLRTLHIGGNPIGGDGISFMSDALSHNVTLTALNLDSVGCSRQGIFHLAESLRQNASITALSLFSLTFRPIPPNPHTFCFVRQS